MSVIETIRVLDGEGVSGREIARRTGVNRETVAKYTSEESFSPSAPVTAREPGKAALLGLTTIIEGWLADDERRPRKQRHTAKRVYDRLCAEHDYAGSYSPVQRFIQQYRRARRTGSEGYLELAWPAGQAQVDFGEAEAMIGGIRTLLHIFIVTFPFSNMRFVQAYRGETAECVCDGLRRVFEYIGVVPLACWCLITRPGSGGVQGKPLSSRNCLPSFVSTIDSRRGSVTRIRGTRKAT